MGPSVLPPAVVLSPPGNGDGHGQREELLRTDIAKVANSALAVWRAEGRRSAARLLDDVTARASAPDAPSLTDEALQDLTSCRWLRAGLAAMDLRFDLAARHFAAGWMGCLEMHGRLGGDDCVFY